VPQWYADPPAKHAISALAQQTFRRPASSSRNGSSPPENAQCPPEPVLIEPFLLTYWTTRSICQASRRRARFLLAGIGALRRADSRRMSRDRFRDAVQRNGTQRITEFSLSADGLNGSQMGGCPARYAHIFGMLRPGEAARQPKGRPVSLRSSGAPYRRSRSLTC